MQIAGEIRDAQAIALHPDETGLATPVGDVHGQLAVVQGDVAGYEKSIGCSNAALRQFIQVVEVLGLCRWLGGWRSCQVLAQLDVLRAIAEGLDNGNSESMLIA